jgi:RNA polymerase sigma-70 factor (ECF subfamily)
MASAEREAKVVRPLAFQVDDATLVAAARRADAPARRQLFERYAHHVARVLTRLLGADGEIADLVHDVFVMALRDLDRLDDPSALKAWLTAIAVNVARGHIRRRVRRRWLRFFAPDEVPEPPTNGADDEAREAARATYAILDEMPADERIAFALRFIDGMELAAAAQACGVSLATIKRRIARAEARFVERARASAVLASRLEGGGRWT